MNSPFTIYACDTEDGETVYTGFDTWAGYDELVFVMTEPIHSKSYKVENV